MCGRGARDIVQVVKSTIIFTGGHDLELLHGALQLQQCQRARRGETGSARWWYGACEDESCTGGRTRAGLSPCVVRPLRSLIDLSHSVVPCSWHSVCTSACSLRVWQCVNLSLLLSVLSRQRPPVLRKGSQSKKAKKSSASASKSRRGVGLKRRAGVKQARARGGRASAPTTTPNGVEHSAVEELEGAKKGSGPPEGKGGAGPKKRQLVGERTPAWNVWVLCV